MGSLSAAIKVQARASMFIYGPFASPDIIQKHCYSDYLNVLGADESPMSFEEANIGVASHLGLDRHSLPPLQQLYNETIASLNGPNGMLGKMFIEDSCALLDTLRGERMTNAEMVESTRDVPRDAHSGLPAAVFARRDE
ncbi:hypothetical protein H9P43_006335 [Blastocladiella emersonii ATCC 22665]|nr:hypothetical protein H9P43_006335 [Blastocladiella emersonii ATCC 22665]